MYKSFKYADTLQSRITRIDEIITGLKDKLNDGQTTIGVTRRSVQEIEQSIMSLERLKQVYIKRINGHTFRAVNY